MGASPDTFLARLEPGVEIAAGKIRGLASAVPALETSGLVTSRKVGRALHVVLTDAGVARRAELAAAAPPPRPGKTAAARPARARKPTAATRLAALEAAVAELGGRLAALERAHPAAVATAATPAVATTPAAADPTAATDGGDRAQIVTALDPTALKAAVLAAVGDLDHRGRYGGLVPIPELRAELRGQGIADDQAVTRALEDLEHDWTIDLLVAQSPTQVTHRAAGIERPGRGLLYYVARR